LGSFEKTGAEMGIRVFRTLERAAFGMHQAKACLTRTKGAFFSTLPLDLM
jgi:hypothetical protein